MTTTIQAPLFAVERLPALDGVAPLDAAESFRDMSGLALLESARPNRRSRWSYLSADPVSVLDGPSHGADPLAAARGHLGRLRTEAGRPPAMEQSPSADHPPFVGGLIGYIGYDIGRALERLPVRAAEDQGLPPLQLALHDWVIAWDRRTRRAWLGGRAVDGDGIRLSRRLEAVRRQAERRPSVAAEPDTAPDSLPFTSSVDRVTYEAGIDAVRAAIADGQIYQANLARRLEAPFAGDPWPLYRRLRTGDPSLFSAFLALGRDESASRTAAPGSARLRALLSASPEPFLAVDSLGTVTTDPIKGTRRRGRDRQEDRVLARELMASAKDRAENVMIVDVLRNDLGRVCRPGSVRVPRLCRLERTATVQHLVSTVCGELAPGLDAFDLLAATLPGGSITGAPKIRAMEILETLERVRRGPYTGAMGWIGADGSMAMSIVIRTFVADGRRLTLHVGGGVTYRSDPAAEWNETVAKAAGPLGAIGGFEVTGA